MIKKMTAQRVPKWVPKVRKSETAGLRHLLSGFRFFIFFIDFESHFGTLWVPLGSLLGPLEALLGGLKSEKMPTVPRENHFFINTGLWFFEDPNGPLGLILVPLGQIWSQNGSQHGCKFDQKVGPKIIKKNIKNGSPPGCHFGFQIFVKSRSPG